MMPNEQTESYRAWARKYRAERAVNARRHGGPAPLGITWSEVAAGPLHPLPRFSLHPSRERGLAFGLDHELCTALERKGRALVDRRHPNTERNLSGLMVSLAYDLWATVDAGCETGAARNLWRKWCILAESIRKGRQAELMRAERRWLAALLASPS